MSNYNHVTLVGRLTRDPELKTTGSGTEVCNFGLAVNRTFSKNDEVDFFNVVAWRQVAKVIAQHKKKGDLILLDGRLQSRKYENKDGITVSTVEVVLDNVQFMPSGGEGGQPKNTEASNDDIPF